MAKKTLYHIWAEERLDGTYIICEQCRGISGPYSKEDLQEAVARHRCQVVR